MGSKFTLQVLFFLLSISILFIEVSGRIENLEYIFESPNSNLRDNYLRFQRSRIQIQRRDRPCLINAGLSQGCDISDMLYAKYQANKFSSFAGPGK